MTTHTPQRIALFGATGSIGTSALDVIARHPERFSVDTLAAGSNVTALLKLCERFKPQVAVIADEKQFASLKQGLQDLGLSTRAEAGDAALRARAAASEVDTVIAAIVGAAGLTSTLAAARAGKRLLLANKESLVLAGELLMQAAQASGATLVPVDSEHNAIFQCMPADGETRTVKRIILTASGGPFRGRTRAALSDITPAQAIAHPNWSMGAKISVDSATLMNKGLEVIEAHHLFAMPASRIAVVVHPQSIVHSMVEYEDGSTLAQLGRPDMRTTLAVGLAWPDRVNSGVEGLDWTQHNKLEFEAPDLETFPALQLAFDAMAAGGTAPAMLNALNEIAVSAFLQAQCSFLGIPALVAAGLDALESGPATSLDALLAADQRARAFGAEYLRKH
ncbi:1-deoxy-D-xylulose-5-phosphate reductoisomerase [Lysobacter sp. HDW10]|uniref:1-deoxy-D-xylulose-5-phosphate reductoisomerase n=1 Tax=Lysobacter sp. HDW10 TaxID=2714936 RepID=UPI00140876EC|nr:1-deoxy-D-xylulose-5-phosphate reductoisomerase [Lysobacter sp. HDW10]QIK80178.1 1-deoxy-D-xylulose-5-phosphate reductoisomerase [Lysobacter sp. HDW10]